jgi:methylated-DNA-[protein]-cysteine S-methyltransferase
MTVHTTYESPLGELVLVGDGERLTELRLPSRAGLADASGAGERVPDAFAEATSQLDAYFAGELRAFDLPLAPSGTPFEERVWAELLTIPYGTTISYAELARRIGCPGAARAVGRANGRNPIPIVIPCHRVIGSSGDLTGYGGGLERKRALLELEGALLPV